MLPEPPCWNERNSLEESDEIRVVGACDGLSRVGFGLIAFRIVRQQAVQEEAGEYYRQYDDEAAGAAHWSLGVYTGP